MTAAVQPIGAATHPGIIGCVHAAHGSLVSALAAWRRRACSIALGNCGDAHINRSTSRPAQRPFDPRCMFRPFKRTFAEYLAQRSAFLFIEQAIDGETVRGPYPIRVWPIHRPIIEAEIQGVIPANDRQYEVGAYIDIII